LFNLALVLILFAGRFFRNFFSFSLLHRVIFVKIITFRSIEFRKWKWFFHFITFL